MKVTISFSNPFAAMIYTVALLTIGSAIGVHWGQSITAGWMLFSAAIFLLLHDAAIAILLAISAANISSCDKK